MTDHRAWSSVEAKGFSDSLAFDDNQIGGIPDFETVIVDTNCRGRIHSHHVVEEFN